MSKVTCMKGEYYRYCLLISIPNRHTCSEHICLFLYEMKIKSLRLDNIAMKNNKLFI